MPAALANYALETSADGYADLHLRCRVDGESEQQGIGQLLTDLGAAASASGREHPTKLADIFVGLVPMDLLPCLPAETPGALRNDKPCPRRPDRLPGASRTTDRRSMVFRCVAAAPW